MSTRAKKQPSRRTKNKNQNRQKKSTRSLKAVLKPKPKSKKSLVGSGSQTARNTPSSTNLLSEFERLLWVVKRLRGKNGCPWDKAQTHSTLTPYAIEEAFELVEAIDSGQTQEMIEELGDLLFQVVLHAELARQAETFGMREVLKTLNEKMIRRHPHVFANAKVNDADEVVRNWNQIKAQEKGKPERTRLDEGIPAALPALIRAQKIGQRTKRLEFDWTQPQEVFAKVQEEVQELEAALAENSKAQVEAELGDVLFSLAQLARHLDLDSEQALRKANSRFVQRFEAAQRLATQQKKEWLQIRPDEREALWNQAKSLEAKQP